MQNCISTESFGKIHNEIKRFSGCALQILYRISSPPSKNVVENTQTLDL